MRGCVTVSDDARAKRIQRERVEKDENGASNRSTSSSDCVVHFVAGVQQQCNAGCNAGRSGGDRRDSFCCTCRRNDERVDCDER